MHELEVEEGPNRGARYALSPGQATIGRDVSCEVSVIDERASRRHVRLELAQDGSVTVEDLESRNGTLLNGLPLLPGARAPLRAGDRIAIGSTVLVLAAGTGLDAASAPTVARTAVGTAGTTGRSVELRAPRDSARVLELVARLGALLSEGDRLGSALSAALEVAGGARAAILVLEGTAPELRSRVIAASHDTPPDLTVEALASFRASSARAVALDGPSGAPAILAIRLPGKTKEKTALLAVSSPGERGPATDPDAWAAIASVLAPHAASAEDERERRLETDEARRAFRGPGAEIVAESPPMKRLLEQAAKAALGNAPVLILGESGSGKELVARAIHAASPRARKRFVAVNASAFPETLLESELFGHERGAFTGAVARRKGLFEIADRGTIFLDEVAELSPATQPKLLRVLESGEVRPLGGGDAFGTDVRIVAATNRDLKELVRRGAFREDLYFRLAVVELRIPPLRERLADLAPLVRHLLGTIARRPVEVEPATIDLLAGYSFPGNVRELRNVLERALLAGDGRSIKASDLPADVRAASARSQDREAAFPTLAEAERAHVEAALRRTGWNRSRAAKLLGIDRKTLYLKVKALGLRAGTSLPDDAEGDEEAPSPETNPP